MNECMNEGINESLMGSEFDDSFFISGWWWLFFLYPGQWKVVWTARLAGGRYTSTDDHLIWVLRSGIKLHYFQTSHLSMHWGKSGKIFFEINTQVTLAWTFTAKTSSCLISCKPSEYVHLVCWLRKIRFFYVLFAVWATALQRSSVWLIMVVD